MRNFRLQAFINEIGIRLQHSENKTEFAGKKSSILIREINSTDEVESEYFAIYVSEDSEQKSIKMKTEEKEGYRNIQSPMTVFIPIKEILGKVTAQSTL